MQDHPLPQDITGYQFHIIGNMTLKQFAEVGFGVFIGFLFYTTNLHDFIKWPLIGLAVGLGVIAAFVPIEERPFDQWVISFFKSIYRPTKFYWKREPKIPDFFLFKPNNDKIVPEEMDLSPARRLRIKEFMFSLQRPPSIDPLEEYQNQRVDQIIEVFEQVKTTVVTEKKNVTKPELVVRVRDLKEKREKKKTEVVETQTGDLITQRTTDANKIAQDVSIPEINRVKVAKEKKEEERVVFSNRKKDENRVFIEASPTSKVNIDPNQVKDTSYNRELPFPSPPTEPNIPVGMTIDESRHLVTNAIVEIIDVGGNVVRAVKTNSLGQFFVTTPLGNGEYTVKAEKDGYYFAPIKLSVVGEILSPIEVLATKPEDQTPTIATIT